MTTDNNSKGIILILIAMSLFSMQDALIKFIFEQSALYEIFFGRYLVAAIVLFIYLSFKGQKGIFKNSLSIINLYKSIVALYCFFNFLYLYYLYATSNC
jgi:drug/metabolite transporter (DMT)-like permease